MGETIEDDETGAGAVAIEVVASQPAPQSRLRQEEGVSCCSSVPSLKSAKEPAPPFISESQAAAGSTATS